MLYIACLFFWQLIFTVAETAQCTTNKCFSICMSFLYSAHVCFCHMCINWQLFFLLICWTGCAYLFILVCYYTSCVYYYGCNYHLQVFRGHICIWKKYTVYITVCIIIYFSPYFLYYSILACLLCWFILICHWITVLPLLITLDLLWQVNFPSEGSIKSYLKGLSQRPSKINVDSIKTN